MEFVKLLGCGLAGAALPLGFTVLCCYESGIMAAEIMSLFVGFEIYRKTKNDLALMFGQGMISGAIIAIFQK